MFAIHWCRASARSATNAFSVNRIRDAYAEQCIVQPRLVYQKRSIYRSNDSVWEQEYFDRTSVG